MTLDIERAETPMPGETMATLSANLAEGPESEANIYGTFFVGESEYAISVAAIQEVVNEPKQFTDVPLSPKYLIGLFNLRGVIIPVVDLAKIFDGASDNSDSLDRKVAIIEHGEHCFGLLVDRTGDVFNAKDAERSVFSRKPGDLRETIVDGVFKLDRGERLVQILDPFELLNLDKLPRVAGALHSALSRRARGRRKQCISFHVGASICAFDMTSIKEIVELDGIDNTALASDWTLGAIELRGATVPVIDFRLFLGQTRKESTQDLIDRGAKLIVMRMGENMVSLLVDAIDEIISFYDDDLLSFPGIGVRRSEIFKGCLCGEKDEMVLLLDHERVVDDEQLKTVTRGHSALFQARDDASRGERHGKSEKRTLITFSVEGLFALDIEKVNEVISFPETVMTPPSMPDFIAGIVNIRGELIPIVNLRVLYNMPVIDCALTKLMIFTHADKKHAIMVDAVSSIVSVTDQNSNVLPKLSRDAASSSISQDVREAILLTDAAEAEASLMVLDLDSLMQRISGTII